MLVPERLLLVPLRSDPDPDRLLDRSVGVREGECRRRGLLMLGDAERLVERVNQHACRRKTDGTSRVRVNGNSQSLAENQFSRHIRDKTGVGQTARTEAAWRNQTVAGAGECA